MQVQWLEYHEVVGTVKPYHMQKNLFELFALTDSRDAKTEGTISCAKEPPLWNFHNIKLVVNWSLKQRILDSLRLYVLLMYAYERAGWEDCPITAQCS